VCGFSVLSEVSGASRDASETTVWWAEHKKVFAMVENARGKL